MATRSTGIAVLITVSSLFTDERVIAQIQEGGTVTNENSPSQSLQHECTVDYMLPLVTAPVFHPQ